MPTYVVRCVRCKTEVFLGYQTANEASYVCMDCDEQDAVRAAARRSLLGWSALAVLAVALVWVCLAGARWFGEGQPHETIAPHE